MVCLFLECYYLRICSRGISYSKEEFKKSAGKCNKCMHSFQNETALQMMEGNRNITIIIPYVYAFNKISKLFCFSFYKFYLKSNQSYCKYQSQLPPPILPCSLLTPNPTTPSSPQGGWGLLILLFLCHIFFSFLLFS